MTIAAEKTAALAVIKRGLAKNFAVVVSSEGEAHHEGGPTRDLAVITDALAATDVELVAFYQKPPQDPKWSARGSLLLVWGNSPEEVVADYSDNLYIREIVGELADADA